MLVNLAVFKAGDNRLTGEIPADWTMSKMLQVFALEFNQMSGTIPPPAPVNLYGASRTPLPHHDVCKASHGTKQQAHLHHGNKILRQNAPCIS